MRRNKGTKKEEEKYKKKYIKETNWCPGKQTMHKERATQMRYPNRSVDLCNINVTRSCLASVTELVWGWGEGAASGTR